MERKVEQAYLYDFYGELLNKRQREIYEDFIFHDCSLAEIAEAEGISRQGVYDLIRRCDRALDGYESKLHLVRKFLDTKARVGQIHALAGEFHKTHEESLLDRIEQISNAILEDL